MNLKFNNNYQFIGLLQYGFVSSIKLKEPAIFTCDNIQIIMLAELLKYSMYYNTTAKIKKQISQ